MNDCNHITQEEHDLALKILNEGELSNHDSPILDAVAFSKVAGDPVSESVYKDFKGLVLQYQGGVIYNKDAATLYIEQSTRALAFQSEMMGAFPDPLILAKPESQAEKEGLDMFLAQLEDTGATVTLQLE